MENDFNYAPIFIATLNRAEHLERCLHSLALNTGVEKTDLFISVDYPPAEKYIDGYNRVRKYLETTSDLNAFHSVRLIYQKKNLGPSGNMRFLKNVVREVSDRYIFSEDDNEFSPNFLEYINKGLRLFENKENVIGINGIKDAEWYTGGENICASKLFPCYGMGSWFDKEKLFASILQETLLDPNNWSISKMISLYKRNQYLFALYVNGIICTNKGLFWESEGVINMCDTTRAITMYLSDFFCIVPQVSKSRNWGNDGSGVNMAANESIDPITRWKLDDKKDFDYSTNNIIYDKRNDKIANNFLTETYGKKLVRIAVFEYLLFLLMGKKRERIIRFRQRIKKK